MATTGTVDGETELALLIQGCARSEAAALRTIYDRHAPFLMGVAQRILRDRALAEEALHDAFMQIWRNAARFDGALGTAEAWVVAIVRYRALDRREREARHARTGDVPFDEAEAAGVMGEVAPEVRAEGMTLQRCLQNLRPEARQSILLAYVQGCSHPEIASLLGHPLGTVKTWISRGLAALKRCIDQ